MKSLILIIFLMFSPIVQAEYELMLGAYHFSDEDDQFSNTVYGVIYKPDRLGVGIFRNSYEKTSILVGYDFPLKNYGFEIGLATEYEELAGNKIQPLADVYYQFDQVKLRLIPGEISVVSLSFVLD